VINVTLTNFVIWLFKFLIHICVLIASNFNQYQIL
jgi:hypothetical protein